MKRRLLRDLFMMILLGSLLLSGCVREEIDEGGKLDPAQSRMQTEATGDITPGEATGSQGAEIALAWNTLQEARTKMAALTALEENQLLYTRKEGSEESITLRLTMTDMGGEDIIIGAAGTVKTQGNVIPLEIYYKDGVMVRSSGSNFTREESTRDAALATVDFLISIRRDMKQGDVTAATLIETADGFKTISLEFTGTISGLPTSGRGEILIDPEGLIASEGYSFEATNKEGKPVSQSVECILLAVNQEVKAVDLPPEIN